jgi:peptidoglycan hydrolase-like protein with peptidoglycan-binding domain
MATDAQGRQLSDDGYYYWDGSNWQPVDSAGGPGGPGGPGGSSSGVPERDLEAGASGEDVRQLQLGLYRLGYHEIEHADGHYDGRTKNAVAHFQRDHGIDPSGSYDSPTQTALRMAQTVDLGPTTGGPDDPGNHPFQGFVRTWIDPQNFVDVSDDDVAAGYLDNFTNAKFVQDITEWDLPNIDNIPVELTYSNGGSYQITFASLSDDSTLLTRLKNQSGVFVPVDDALTPVLSAGTVRRLLQLRQLAHNRAAEVAQQNLEIAQMVYEFAHDIADLGEAAQANKEVWEAAH